MVPESQRQEAERLLCTGGHRHCRLHFTKGELPEDPGPAARERAVFQAQAEKNRAYARENRLRNQMTIQKLAQRLQNTILLQEDVTERRAQSGAHSTPLTSPSIFSFINAQRKAGFSIRMVSAFTRRISGTFCVYSAYSASSTASFLSISI